MNSETSRESEGRRAEDKKDESEENNVQNQADSALNESMRTSEAEIEKLVKLREILHRPGNADDREELLRPQISSLVAMLRSESEEVKLLALEINEVVSSTCSQEIRALQIENGLAEYIVGYVENLANTKKIGGIPEKMEPMLLYTTRTVRCLTLSQNGRKSLVDNEVVDPLVRVIDVENLEAKGCALRATFNLSVMNKVIRQKIVDAGALPLLLEASLVQFDGQCAAIGTLANLATESDIKRAIVQDHNGLNPLLKLLDSTDESILTHACRALFAIAANDDNKVAIAKAGGLKLLLNCIDCLNDSVRMNAAGALANLAIHPVNKLELVRLGALSKFRQLANSTNSKIQRQVARCLFALAAHTENRRAMIEERCLESLKRLLDAENPDVQLNAAGAIGNIAMTDEYKSVVVESGALERLLELARDSVERVQRQAARAIFTLTAKDQAKARLVELDGLQVLVTLARSDNEDIQRDAAGALANMAIGTEHKDRIVQLGGLQPLLSRLDSSNVAVQRQAARSIFALAGTSENQQRIISEGGLKPLIDLLDSTNDEVQKHACGAIANIANRFPDKVVQFKALRKLVAIVLSHSNVEVRRQAARAVYNLSPAGKQRMQMMLSPYAGVVGEQQRIRHDLRALFQMTMENQTTAAEAFATDSVESDVIAQPIKRTRVSSIGDSRTPVFSNPPMVQDFSFPMSPIPDLNACPIDEDCPTSSEETPSSSNDQSESKGKKRSCEESSSKILMKRVHRVKERTSGFDADLQISLPISSSESGGHSVVTWHNFYGHAAILAARCSMFDELISKEQVSGLEDCCYIQVPESFANPVTVWNAFLEYIYTDSVRVHALNIREEVSIARDLAELSMRCNLPRLCCFCLELHSELAATFSLKEKGIEENRASTWTQDMGRLLADPFTEESNLRSKLSFDVNLKVAEMPESKVGAYKVLLVSRCSYFKAQFGGSQWRDSKTTDVDFPGSKAALELILRYLYCGFDQEKIQNVLHSDPSLALQVLVLSNQYNLDGLQMQCELVLLDNINEMTITVLLQELDLVHAPLLRSVCLLFLVENLSTVLRCKQSSKDFPRVWTAEERDALSREFGASVADELLNTAVRWGFHEGDGPGSIFAQGGPTEDMDDKSILHLGSQSNLSTSNRTILSSQKKHWK